MSNNIKRPTEDHSAGRRQDVTANPQSTPYGYATAPSIQASEWANDVVTPAQLVRRVAKAPIALSKKGPSFFPGVLKQNRFRRIKTNVESRTFLALDFDSAPAGWVPGVLPWCSVAYETYSSTPEAPRYRVLVFFTRPVLAEEWTAFVEAFSALWQDLVETVGDMPGVGAGLDKSCLDLVQAVYEPRRPGKAPLRLQDNTKHAPLDVDKLLAAHAPVPDELTPDLSAREFEEMSARLRDPFTLDGVVGAFNRAYAGDFAGLVKAYELPYEPGHGDKWHLIGARSEAGVSEFRPGYIYSHHDTDPASGAPHSYFDLVRIHRFGGTGPDWEPSPSHASMTELALEDERVRKELGSDDPPGREVVLAAGTDEMTLWAQKSLGTGKTANMFRRGRDIVKVTPDCPDTLQRLAPAGVLANITSATHFINTKGRTLAVPQTVASMVCGDPSLYAGLRDLRGVTGYPLVREDGSLLTEPGYDEASGMYLLPRGELPDVPDTPTPDEIAGARGLLLYLVRDFPFRTDNDRANYLGALVGVALRLAVPGRSKALIINAPDAGSGKTLLAKLLIELFGGVIRGAWPSSEDEVSKELSTILDSTADPVVVFDNCRGTIRSDKFEALLTNLHFTARRLGGNTEIVAHNDKLWVLTGNNLSIGGDLARRMLVVTIDANMARPYTRKADTFSEPDLLGYVRRNRPALQSAVLTLVRGWVLDGWKTPPGESDDFSDWRSAVSGVLAFAGIPGEFDSLEDRQEEISEDDADWAEFVGALYREVGGDPWRTRDSRIQNVPAEDWPEELGRARMSDNFPKVFGKWLSNREGRGAPCVRRVSQSKNQERKNSVLWQIERVPGSSPGNA